jgi:hypothetical protein
MAFRELRKNDNRSQLQSLKRLDFERESKLPGSNGGQFAGKGAFDDEFADGAVCGFFRHLERCVLLKRSAGGPVFHFVFQ